MASFVNKEMHPRIKFLKHNKPMHRPAGVAMTKETKLAGICNMSHGTVLRRELAVFLMRRPQQRAVAMPILEEVDLTDA